LRTAPAIAAVRSWRIEGRTLVIEAVDDLAPVRYTLLVARHPDGTSEALPFVIDPRSLQSGGDAG
jgi:hypothetical protein